MAWSGPVDCQSLQQHCKKIFPCPFVGVQTPSFFTQKGLMTDGLGIWAIAGEDITVSTLLLDDLSDHTVDSWVSGERAAERFLEKNPKPGTFIHFPEFFSFEASFFLHGFHGRIGPGFRHVGGMVNSKSAGGNCYFTEKGGGGQRRRHRPHRRIVHGNGFSSRFFGHRGARDPHQGGRDKNPET
ncbi:MAG: FIST N-terminal domain-containing protein [Thermovirgaceae bacterium]